MPRSSAGVVGFIYIFLSFAAPQFCGATLYGVLLHSLSFWLSEQSEYTEKSLYNIIVSLLWRELLSPIYRDSGIYEQPVISTKWTKWTHGEILSLHSCRREFEFAPTLYNPAELGATVYGDFNHKWGKQKNCLPFRKGGWQNVPTLFPFPTYYQNNTFQQMAKKNLHFYGYFSKSVICWFINLADNFFL